ncbi:MAG: VOC family protein [Novosphingobium sp.]
MANPTGGFIWYELMTGDPDNAARFYEAVVGWKFSTQSNPQAGDIDYRHISRSDSGAGGGVLRLTEDMTSHGARPMWAGYIHVADVDNAVDAIKADGGTVTMPPMDLPVGRMAMVADPQGAPFYVMTPVPPPGQPDAKSDVFSPDQPQHVRWNELRSSDPDAAVAFYTKHFGWTQQGDMDMGPMGKYRFIQHEGTGIGAIMGKPAELPMSLWGYYIGVDDIDRAIEAIKVQGGKIIHGPMEIPGGEFSLDGIDPQGAVFGLVGPRKS